MRLRHVAGLPQGAIVSGGGRTRQRASDPRTGTIASLSGPNYSATGQPFGGAEDPFVAGIHRGDAFGMAGRWISLFTGLALIFSLSGAVM